jgi:ketosteroid isomerase-like protein
MDVTELIERTRITETLHRYCHGVDDCDLDAVLALFAPDARVDMGHGAVFVGHAALRALLIDRLGQWTSTSHQASTISVTRFDGTTADTTSYLFVVHDDTVDGRTMHLWGRYDDHLRRGDDGWQFVHRKLWVSASRILECQPLPERFEPSPRRTLPAPRTPVPPR